MSSEKLIKTRKRVKQHGEVFTPVKIVREMIDLDGIKNQVRDIRKLFLEPAVGEGVFLVEILKVRLKNLSRECKSITEYENKSLVALSSLYGIELLEDNVQKCVMNLYMEYILNYEKALEIFGKRKKNKVIDTAKTIIASNIQQGNFLTRLNAKNEPIIFSRWREIENKNKNTIKVVRSEHSLEDIYNEKENPDGFIYEYDRKANKPKFQISLMDLIDYGTDKEDYSKQKNYRYISCSISDVYKEEMEEYEG